METNELTAEVARLANCSHELAAECIAKRPHYDRDRLVSFAQFKARDAQLKQERLARETALATETKPHCANPLHSDKRWRLPDGHCALCAVDKRWAKTRDE